jgi:Zn-dependent protease with chaperone function
LIILAIVKLLLQLNFSTINPSLRISLIETIQKFFTVGFLLVSIIPLVRLMISVNNSVVGIFATQIDLSLGGQPAVGDGAIATLLIQFVYFFIFLFVNFTYIMRSIMLAILTASGPLLYQWHFLQKVKVYLIIG